ncbi:MAG: amidohydrolase, partial [Betaproteobacteria bacterium]|nr:amidohydrolase [Betaproteobacteria bacterium]
RFEGTVYLIFQPAEEGEGGARRMMAQGLFEQFPMQAVFGLHNWPALPVGQFGVMPGPVMAAADQFDIRVRGQGAHAAMPHQGTDAIVAASALVQSLQTIASRTLDPLDAAVISVTRFQAGGAYNVIPEEALLAGTVRTFRPAVQQTVVAAIARLCEGIGKSFGVNATLDYQEGYPSVVNSPAETQTCRAVAASVVGERNVRSDLRPSMGAEDFAFMLQAKPGCYVVLGSGQGDADAMLHNPRYDFNDEILPIGAAYWARLVEHWLPPPSVR